MKRITPIVILLFFAGCSKPDTEQKTLELSGEFQTITTATLGPVTMYFKGGTTTDSTAIINFLVNGLNNPYNKYSFNSKNEVYNNTVLYLNLKDSGKVTVRYYLTPYLKDQYEGQIINRTSTEIIIQKIKKDTVYYYSGFPIIPPILPAISIGKIQQTETCTDITLASGYPGKLCTLQYIFPLIIENNEMYLPLFTYTFSRRRTNSWSSSTVSYNMNILNSDLASQLADGDTVVVQTKKLKLEKL